MRRGGGFGGVEPARAPVYAKRGVRRSREEIRRDRHTPGYEPTNMFFTRDSLYWGWRRVKEYYDDVLELREDERKEKIIRIDRG